ncbi:TetR/AcrR family transcriptional regulator [Micromonospora sp. LAH09]|uniref:TetR/AcrR family transcriptional regulator n=1 Tax=Micromonospora cabrerizensis TaxID=2911213 RepID=UPI001EE8ED54|nr:TetR/AcrR family transcriptional regulator [Micromonospora cabrerizensis]MCG5470824.1 TetR/AcrR family transcriptional regulator [Micromonospora cabrerizensis]
MTLPQKQRADARSNRERVLAAARETFAVGGLEAPMREVARRAGIGVATLYRHFPTRAELVTTVLAERVEACGVQMRRALDDPDPWRALSGTVLEFADRQVRDQALNEALLGSGEVGAAFGAERREHAQALNVLVARARAAGVLRAGVGVDDVRAGLLAIASLRRLPARTSAQVIGRLADLVLAGIRV